MSPSVAEPQRVGGCPRRDVEQDNRSRMSASLDVVNLRHTALEEAELGCCRGRLQVSRPGVLRLRTAAWWKKSMGVELHLEEGS